MANRLIFVGSVTNAMRGKKLLEEKHIRAFIQRATSPSAGDGCGYSLLVTEDAHRAEQILRDSGVRVIRTQDTL
ncbi:MAG: DUF3343 domain-containing protein [Clostridia bacterium]|nr:DUF3343 domain-containing protein [Clostridia bacterium]